MAYFLNMTNTFGFKRNKMCHFRGIFLVALLIPCCRSFELFANESPVDIYDRLSRPIVTKCDAAIQELVRGARDGSNGNAARVFDSIGRPGAGLLQGNFIFFGDYEQCTDTEGAQYCLINIKASNDFYSSLSNHSSTFISAKTFKSLSMRLGICLPTVCTLENVQNLVTKYSSKLSNKTSITVEQCIDTHKKIPWETVLVVVFGSLLVLLLLALVIGTFLDRKLEPSKQEESLLKQLFLAFSLSSNLKAVLSVEKPTLAQSVDVFNGLRVLAMFTIIFFHSFANGSYLLSFSNPLRLWTDPLSPIVFNLALSVDTFFYIAGFLQASSLLRLFAKWNTSGGAPTGVTWSLLAQSYIKRYIRLTPVMMVLIAFGILVLKHLGNGPNWAAATISSDGFCSANWWTNALYVQNFIHPNEACLTHTWYLAVDMQFFALSPVFVYLLAKYPQMTYTLGLVLIAGSAVGTALLTVENNYPAVSYFTKAITTDQLVGYYQTIYVKPYFRLSPYLIGALSAHFFLHRKKTPLPLNRVLVIGGWILSLGTIIGLILALYGAHQGRIPSVQLAAAYSATARTAWALALAWIVYASLNGAAGWLGAFLSHPLWLPLSRLTFSAYLVHPFVIALTYGRTTQTEEYSFMLMFNFTLSIFVISLLLALLLVLTVEFPLVSVGNILLKRIFPPLPKKINV